MFFNSNHLNIIRDKIEVVFLDIERVLELWNPIEILEG